MKDIDKVLQEVFAYLDENWDGTPDEEPPAWLQEMINEHGPVVAYRMDAYHDVRVYADGYEDRMYIGD